MADNAPRRPIRAQDARQGEIILRTPLRKAIFIGGLVGIGLLAILMTALAGCVPVPPT